VPGGRVSNYLNDTLEVGQTLRVFGPSGVFGARLNPLRRRHAVLLAGGSGVTPLMAVARGVLAVEQQSRVTLLFGNRSERDILFAQSLGELVAKYRGRFVVRHVLQDPPVGWTEARGLLTRDVIEAELESFGGDEGAEYFICGPTPMMAEARAALRARCVDDRRIQQESFKQAVLSRREDPPVGAGKHLVIRVGGESRETIASPSQTILEAGLAAGLAMPFSCTVGGCAACKVKLLEGEAEMEEPHCLTEEERNSGFVLACVARAITNCVIQAEGAPPPLPVALA
jgi:ring-1,2-phenylacetyl-CoA epoxidase subunit PaaE